MVGGAGKGKEDWEYNLGIYFFVLPVARRKPLKKWPQKYELPAQSIDLIQWFRVNQVRFLPGVQL